jgi:AAT family amino acid transporter/D-serine/D-alanine/glycine transporter
VPSAGIHASAALMLIGVALNYLVPSERVFVWVTSVALVGTFWTWGIILVSHRNYRRAVQAGKARAAPFRMPGAPYANWLVLAFLVAVSAMFWGDRDNRVALYVPPIWFGLLGCGYFIMKARRARST